MMLMVVVMIDVLILVVTLIITASKGRVSKDYVESVGNNKGYMRNCQTNVLGAVTKGTEANERTTLRGAFSSKVS